MSLLSSVRARVTVDVDSMNPAVASTHSADGTIKFTDMTSNQAIAYGEATRTEQAPVLTNAIALAKSQNPGANIDAVVERAVDIFVRVPI